MSDGKYKSIRKALSLFDALDAEKYQSSKTLGLAIGVRDRTVQDYLDLFKEFDWPVESSHAKGHRLSELAASARLTEKELFLFAILLAQGGSTLPCGEFETLSTKLTRLLSKASRNQVESFHDKVESDPSPHQDFETLAAVGRCLADPHFQIVMDYKKGPDEPVERRNILPLALKHKQSYFYVDSYDLDKKGFRSYRLDRFVSARLLKQEHPIPRPKGGVTETHKWDFGQGEATAVTIQLSPRLASWLKENPEHSSQVIDAGHQATYQVRRLDMFVDWFMGLRGAQAVGPQELLDKVRERAAVIAETLGTLEVRWE